MMTLKITNMKCQGCANKITTGLKEADINATVVLENKEVIVEDKDVDKAQQLITSLGYKVE